MRGTISNDLGKYYPDHNPEQYLKDYSQIPLIVLMSTIF